MATAIATHLAQPVISAPDARQAGVINMPDIPSAVAYGVAAQGQAVFGTGPTAAAWAYSPWDTTTITAAAGLSSGTTPPVPVVVAGSTLYRGSVTFGTGGSAAAGSQVTVAFSATLPTTPYVQLTETNSATAALAVYPTAVTTTGFTISTQGGPTASQANTVYAVNYQLSL
jgi:hypothetical protein